MSKLGLELFDAFKWTAEDDEALRDAFDKHQVWNKEEETETRLIVWFFLMKWWDV